MAFTAPASAIACAKSASAGKTRDVHRLDADTGEIDWSSTIPEVEVVANHQMAFVPDAFGTGSHGIYFNGDSSGNAPDGIADVYGIRIDDRNTSIQVLQSLRTLVDFVRAQQWQSSHIPWRRHDRRRRIQRGERA